MSALVTIRDLHVTLGDAPIRGIARPRPRPHTALMDLNGSARPRSSALLKETPGRSSFIALIGHRGSGPSAVRSPPQPSFLPSPTCSFRPARPLFLGIPRKVQERMAHMLGRVGAPAVLLTRPVERLSGGELQRVLLALALEPTPELLMLDEPAAGVDFKDQEAFYDLIMRLNRENGVTILLVSHDTHVVSRHVDHVWCLRDGRIHCEGPPGEILTPQMLHEVFGKDRTVFTHQH